MEQRSTLPFYLSFLPNGVAQGIIGTLIPIYMVQVLGATLIDIGVMTFAASALLIPSSILLGSLPDRTRASKPFVLLSFLASSVILFIMSSTSSVFLFQSLYVVLALALYLKGPSTSILIAESFERRVRGSVIANQGFVESMGGVIGLGLCSVLILLLPVTLILPMPASAVFAAVILSLVAVSWSIYYVGYGLVTILYAQPGSLGLYDAFANLGGAIGNYTGGLIPTIFGFEALFIFSGILYAVALMVFHLSRV